MKSTINNKISIKVIFTIIILCWCIGFIIPSFFPQLFPVLNNLYSNVCHQNILKCIWFNKFHFLICARCTGIYSGALLLSIVNWFLNKNELPIKYLFIASVPMLADIALYTFGFYNYNKSVAFITGFILGSFGFIYIWEGFQNLLTLTKKER